MADKPIALNVGTPGPIGLGTTLTINIISTASTVVSLVRMLWFCNRLSSPATVSLWVGAPSGNVAGTELVTGLVIPANSVVPYYFNPALRLDNGTNMVGGSNTNSAISMLALGYQQVA